MTVSVGKKIKAEEGDGAMGGQPWEGVREDFSENVTMKVNKEESTTLR